MLLRRFIDHVKTQNWTAVTLDFLIVVIGVFMGLQFSNWNAARSDAQAEQQILKRLQDELSSVDAEFEKFEVFTNEAFKNLSSAREVLLGMTDRTGLTEKECLFLGISHQPFSLGLTLPMIAELSATGRLALIKNGEIVAAITSFSLAQANADEVRQELHPYRVPLATEFPDLFSVGLKKSSDPSDIDGYEVSYFCSIEKMKQNSPFLNAMVQNVAYANLAYENGTLLERKALKSLRIAVVSEVGNAQTLSENEP